MTNPIVLDISHWQPDPIDWNILKLNGTQGIIHKATQGTSYVDEDLFHRASAAMKAGLLWSTYHFFERGNVQAQIDHYLKTVNPRQGERMCLDHEADASLAELEQAVTYLHSKRPDVQISIYSGHTIKEQLGERGFSQVLGEFTSLWLAQYTTGTPTWPKATWPFWSLWQYSQTEKVTGISGSVDGNKWNGTPEALVAWFGPTSTPTPAPTPTPGTPTVTLGLVVEGTVQVRVTLNGEEIYAST